ncbi:MAG TPA: hypothetical protein PKC21_04795 [Oligoflexia bacterium]|nr:hypothetical protein [Oligoflexia bacterium]HMR24655.1 hypothetical protein [Oligoflexia bacterium]
MKQSIILWVLFLTTVISQVSKAQETVKIEDAILFEEQMFSCVFKLQVAKWFTPKNSLDQLNVNLSHLVKDLNNFRIEWITQSLFEKNRSTFLNHQTFLKLKCEELLKIYSEPVYAVPEKIFPALVVFTHASGFWDGSLSTQLGIQNFFNDIQAHKKISNKIPVFILTELGWKISPFIEYDKNKINYLLNDFEQAIVARSQGGEFPLLLQEKFRSPNIIFSGGYVDGCLFKSILESINFIPNLQEKQKTNFILIKENIYYQINRSEYTYYNPNRKQGDAYEFNLQELSQRWPMEKIKSDILNSYFNQLTESIQDNNNFNRVEISWDGKRIDFNDMDDESGLDKTLHVQFVSLSEATRLLKKYSD